MAQAAECSKRSIINIRNNLRFFGQVRAPSTRVGRRRSITPPMIQTICDHLLEKPELYVDGLVLFFWDEFHVWVTNSSLKRALASVGWSKKSLDKEQRSKMLIYEISICIIYQNPNSYHLIYVDESRCDNRVGFRRTGWSPLGLTPLQVSKFHRDQRYQILPAYILTEWHYSISGVPRLN